ncbi:hypothetical protein GBAR_LOCUS9794, partial [Geodia barretti]
MQTKYRKKNDPVIPNLNKDQVRFYYYRTWHKVSALLNDPSQSSSTEGKKSKLAKSPCVVVVMPCPKRDLSQWEDSLCWGRREGRERREEERQGAWKKMEDGERREEERED